MTKRKPLPPLTEPEAVGLADTIIPLIAVDVRRAVANMAMLEGGNEVAIALAGVKVRGGGGQGLSMVAFRVMLALDVSRLFDALSRDRDKASLPQLAALLAIPGVGAAMANRHQSPGGYWHRRASASLGRFNRGWNALQASAPDQDALGRLRALRDYQIAHTIHGRPPADPKYGEIFRLVRIARLLTTHAERLTHDGDSNLAFFMRDRRDQAAKFWERFIAGVRAP